MSTTLNSKLLRRTAVAFAAVASIAISLPVSAQSNSLKKSTGETICTYSGMSVTPSGGIVVTCDGTTTPPPTTTPGDPGNYSVSGPSTLAGNTSGSVTITRNVGNTGDATVYYAIAGGCSPSNGEVTFLNAGPQSRTLSMTAMSTAGTCTMTLTANSGAGSIGSPAALPVTITAASGPLPQPPTGAGCPTPPNDVLDFDLKLSGADRLMMSSGRIAAAILPKVSDTRNSFSGQIIFAEGTTTPRNGTIEISVTKCRGVIDTNGGLCYTSVPNTSFMKLEWVEKAIWGARQEQLSNIYRTCNAFIENGPFYVNVRYTYSAADCTYGGPCGYTNQWNYAGY